MPLRRHRLLVPAALASLLSGCGLVLDLDPDDRRSGDAVDGGGSADGAASADAKPGDGRVDRWDAGDDGLDGSLWTDAGGIDPDDAAVVDDGGGTGPDGRVVRPDDAGRGDAGATDFCTPVDCDGDGTFENLAEDPANCGVCDRSCGLRYCCNGECVTGSTCAIVC